MAEENFNEQETEVMLENSVPVEVQVTENEQGDDDDAVENEAVMEKEQGNSFADVPLDKRWPGWPGENVYRILVPVQKVGSIIGRKGEYIKKTTEETRARIKILDGPPGSMERCVSQIYKATFQLSKWFQLEEPKIQIAVIGIECCKC